MSEHETPAENPAAPAAVQASHVVMMTAQALKVGSLAEADYDVEITDQHGNTVQMSGTLRLKPYEISAMAPTAIDSDALDDMDKTGG